MKRIGIVGLGLNNPYFYAPLFKQMNAQVAWVWDYSQENAQAYAQKFSCELVQDVNDFPQVDGVMIESRNCDHLSLAQRFLKHGIPVFIEKPLSHSVPDALAFLYEYKDAPVFSASPLRFAPSYLQMQQDVLACGEPVMHCHVTVYHTMKFFLSNPAKLWHDDPEQSGGMMMDIGIHAVELLNMFMPYPVKKMQGYSTKCHYLKARCDDNYMYSIVYENGALANVSMLCATERTDYSVSAVTPSHAFINNRELEYTGLPEWNADNAYGGFYGTIQAFLKMIETGRPPVPIQETIHNFEMLAQMQQILKQS